MLGSVTVRLAKYVANNNDKGFVIMFTSFADVSEKLLNARVRLNNTKITSTVRISMVKTRNKRTSYTLKTHARRSYYLTTFPWYNHTYIIGSL